MDDSKSQVKSGDWPIRMKGYYRALKRNDEWAVRLSKLPPLQFILNWIYRPSIMEEIFRGNKNPFLDILKEPNGFDKHHYRPVSIPVQFPNKDGKWK